MARMMHRGHTGSDVTELQGFLSSLNFRIEVDGVFGPQTESTVRSYQTIAGLETDGIVGPETQKHFKKITPVYDGSFNRKRLSEIAFRETTIGATEANGGHKKYMADFQKFLSGYGWPWCGAFVYWCCKSAGLNIPLSVPGDPNHYTFALVEAWQQWAIRMGFYIDAVNKSITPQRGDIVLFDWSGPQVPDRDFEDHIGVFLYKEGSSLICAEGNTMNAVLTRKRYPHQIQGYIRIPDGFTF